jgi:hypothetical protein
MMGAISLMAFPSNHLSRQNKVLVPSPISVTTANEKKSFKSALAWKGKEAQGLLGSVFLSHNHRN